MKKIFIAFIALFLSTQIANAKDYSMKETSNFEGRYFSMGYVFGKTIAKEDGDKNTVYEPSFKLAVGTSLSSSESDLGKLRVAADWTYRSFEMKEFDIDVLLNTFGANAYYDFNTGTNFTPYVNAMFGVSYAHLKLGDDESKTKINFAYGVGLGISYKINDKTDIDFGYRYSEMAGKVAGFEISNKDVLLSLRLQF
ncbi:MAG: opacity family porin [Alphaproteobacteria bacterium]|nr:opacity family porin [Alphaproteobacteria bacterium]